jgi:D-lactate dehydrogenase
VAEHMGLVTSLARKSLGAVTLFHIILGTTLMKSVSGIFRTVSGNILPAWNRFMPAGAKKIRHTNNLTANSKKVVYFPSCINRAMGVSRDHHEEIQVTEIMQELLKRAGYEIIFPERLDELCCGMAFSSKGFRDAGLFKSKELEEALWKSSDEGHIPILCDMSPCLYTMKENMEPRMKLYEPVEFILNYIVKELTINKIDEPIMVFPVCSAKKMGLESKLMQLAGLCSTQVFVPETNCCGFAGDRGFSYPELNKHGLRNLVINVPKGVRQGYSTSRTCEIGLSLNSKISFKSIIYLVEKASRVEKRMV